MRITITDMAEQLGLSTSTISRALNDHPRVSAKTKKRVRALADQMGYIPNEMAKGLRLQETKILGFITQGFASTYSGDVLQAVEETASKLGYGVIVGTSRGSSKIEHDLIVTFMGRKVDGLIVVPVVSDENIGLYQSLLDNGFPLIFLDRHLPEVECSYITTDNYRGASEAVMHLVNQGYRKIACLAGLEALCFEVEERIRGYIDVLDEHSLVYRQVYGEHSRDQYKNHIHYGYLSTVRMLQAHDNGPDAIFAVNDEMALGSLKACVQEGLNVPHDIGIVGFDNLVVDAYLPISLSSVHQPKHDMGSMAVEWLIDTSNDRENKSIFRKLLVPSLVIRESTRRS